MRSNTVLIDWVSITSKIHTATDMMALVGFPDASSWQVGRGMHGYTNRYWRDNISIHYNRQRSVADFLRYGGHETEDTGGVWLEMSGQGCRAFESLSDGNYDRLFKTVIDNPEDMNITRLDVAFDEYDGMLDIDRICSDVAAQKYRGKKLYDTQKTFWEVIQSSNGKSCQVGSPSSMVLVRIYDKLAERLGKIKDPLEQQKIQNEIDHWTRVEIQFRDDRAREFVKYLYSGVEKASTEVGTDEALTLGQAYARVLVGYLDFGYETAARGHPEKKVWHRYDYWERLVGDVSKLSIYRKVGLSYNLQKCCEYVSRQAGNAVDALLQIYGTNGFLNLIDNRTVKQNPKYRNLVQEVSARQGGHLAEDYVLRRKRQEQDAKHAAVQDKLRQVLTGVFKDKPYYDGTGKRWCVCEVCSRIRPIEEMRICYNIPGKFNEGVCRDCF